jgi:two-component system, chemotaxis family, chemotaxis protein CheY
MKRILIVEDDRDLRFVIRMVLERAGYEVAEARHGAAALESIGTGPPDLVIADLTMPVMSGLELVDRIRSNPATVSIPVVMLSGLEVDSATSQRVDAVVMKPFEPDHLLASIDRALQAGRGERAP